MSSYLTFITNEQGRSLADRFSVLLGKNTRAFDCLVGYFYLSGFKRLAGSLEPTEKIRILIGLNTDQPTFELLSQAKEQLRLDLRSHAEGKERVPGEILSELENVEDIRRGKIRNQNAGWILHPHVERASCLHYMARSRRQGSAP